MSSSASSKNSASPDFALLQFLADGVVVVVTVLDGVVEDGGVRGQPRNRELLNVAAQRAAGQQTAGDVVEPEALAHFVELLNRFHHFSPGQNVWR